MNWQTSRQTNLTWKRYGKTVREGIELISGRKTNLLEEFGLFTSAHILTFPTEFKTEYDRMDGCARAVNDHFFQLRPSRLAYLWFVSNSCPKTNQIQFRTKWACIWGSSLLSFLEWWLFLKHYLSQCNIQTIRVYSCVVLRRISKNWYTFKIHSHSKVPNSFAFELLAHWCICCIWAFKCLRKNKSVRRNWFLPEEHSSCWVRYSFQIWRIFSTHEFKKVFKQVWNSIFYEYFSEDPNC